jgi:hypothetical protein
MAPAPIPNIIRVLRFILSPLLALSAGSGLAPTSVPSQPLLEVVVPVGLTWDERSLISVTVAATSFVIGQLASVS